MLSVNPIRVEEASSRATYFAQNSRESYYADGGEPPGQWKGGAATYLNLSGFIQEDHLNRLFRGVHPETGASLVMNAGEDHKPGWDCTFSSPKSVSAIWAIADPDLRSLISQAQEHAVQAGIEFLERHALCHRYGPAGVERVPTQNALVATFEHATSRNGDPQLHTHAIIANMALTDEGTWRCVDLDLRWKKSAGAMYRAELANQLQGLGFAIEREGNYFKVEGVPQDLTEHWSSRRQEVLAHSQEAGLGSGRGSEYSALSSRQDKQEVDRPKLFAEWQGEAESHGFGLGEIQEIRHDRVIRLASPTPESILAEIMEHQSTFTKPQLMAEVAIQSQGALKIEEIEGLANRVMQHETCVPLKSPVGLPRYTTQEMIDLETTMVEKICRLATRHSHPASKEGPGVAALSEEQRSALAYLTTQSGQVASMSGMAGTGKSYLLGQANHAWQAEGYQVMGVALSGKAAQGLEQGSGILSQTLHSLCHELDKGRLQLNSQTVLVVDEASMVGSRKMARLVDEVEQSGAKLVLIGDVKQLQPIEAGQAFGAITDQIGSVELNEIRRQNDDRERQMVHDFAAGNAKAALLSLAANQRLHVTRNGLDCQKQAADAAIADRVAGKSTVLLAATRYEVRVLNEMARHEAKKQGLVDTLDVLLETAQGLREFAVGDAVVFLRNHRGLNVKNGTLGVVEEATEKGLRVKDQAGKSAWVNFDFYNHLDHSYALTTHKAQGATFDRAHVVIGELSGREWSYVAASRARESTHIYTTKEVAGLLHERGSNMDKAVQNLATKMVKSQQKDTTLSYRG